MSMEKLYRVICLSALIGAWSTSSVSAEFQDSDVLPHITGIGFDQDFVGFTSDSPHLTDMYFLYDRANHTMVETEAKRFQERFPTKTLLNEPRTASGMNDLVGHTSNGVKYGLKLKYCGEGTTDGTRMVIVNNKIIHIRTREKCTNVSSIEMVDGKLWLGTAYNGEAGLYAAEGIIVQDVSGANVVARITALSGWVSRIHLDPFSGNIWAITENGIYEISPEFKILSINLFYHDFDPSTGTPRVLFSEEPTPGNPFAVIARLLPIEDRHSFYEAVAKIPREDLKEFTVYDFFMCCDFNAPKYPESFRPLVPFFIKAGIRNDPSLKDPLWRQSICRLGGPEIVQYCHRAQ